MAHDPYTEYVPVDHYETGKQLMIVRYCWGVCVHHGTELHHPGDCDTQFVTVTVTVLHTLYNVKWFHLKTYTIGERFIRVYCGCTCDPSSSDDAVAGTFW